MDHIEITSDFSRLDLDYIHRFLQKTYWAEGIPRDVVVRSIENSYCFGIFKSGRQIGFARVVTDYTTFAYLADVFIDHAEQRKGYGRMLVGRILDDERLKNLRRWHLITKDAQNFYKSLSFSEVANPEGHLEKYRKPDYRDR